MPPLRSASGRPHERLRPAWPYWLAFPLDAFGLFLVLAASDIIPAGWYPKLFDGVLEWVGPLAMAACVLARVLLVMTPTR